MNQNNTNLSDYEDILIEALVALVSKNPSCVGRINNAIQEGISNALDIQLETSASLAYAMALFVDESPKTVAKNREKLQNGLKALRRFFTGAEFANKLDQYIDND